MFHLFSYTTIIQWHYIKVTKNRCGVVYINCSFISFYHLLQSTLFSFSFRSSVALFILLTLWPFLYLSPSHYLLPSFLAYLSLPSPFASLASFCLLFSFSSVFSLLFPFLLVLKRYSYHCYTFLKLNRTIIKG
jgi:hypothetical protein